MERDQASASTHLESVETPSKAATADVRGQQIRKADYGAYHVQCPLARGVRHSPLSNDDARRRTTEFTHRHPHKSPLREGAR